MKKRLILIFLFVVYSALLIRVMVFKDLPTIHIGQLLFKLGGTDSGAPNFVPFTTIVPYLFGNQGLVIAGANLLGNIALLVPLGVLTPFVFREITWKKAFTIAVAAGLGIEVMQATLRIGIFDVDDVTLNALGVMTGYWLFLIFAKWISAKNFKNIAIAVMALVCLCGASFYALYPKNQAIRITESTAPQSGDPCGGTRGTGEITAISNDKFVLRRNDNHTQTIKLTGQTIYKNVNGSASKSDLKTGQRVTVVVEDGETASDVFMCKASALQ